MIGGTVIVTGVSSFIGVHLAESFVAAGWHVLGTISRTSDSYDSLRSMRLARLAGRAGLRRLDLRDGDAVAALVAAENPDLWVHHAGFAQNYASLNYDLAAGHAINVLPLDPLYRALAGSGCGVLVTGSSAEYAASGHANKEEDACWPDTPYGLSKLAETLRARELALTHGVPTRVARVYIPVGPLDSPMKLLPRAAAALRTGQALDLTSCGQKRDFLSIADLCAGYHKLAADLPRTAFDLFNLARGEATVLKDLLLELARAMSADAALFRFGAVPMRTGEPLVSYGDIDKARALLGWVPRPLADLVKDVAHGLA